MFLWPGFMMPLLALVYCTSSTRLYYGYSMGMGHGFAMYHNLKSHIQVDLISSHRLVSISNGNVSWLEVEQTQINMSLYKREHH